MVDSHITLGTQKQPAPVSPALLLFQSSCKLCRHHHWRKASLTGQQEKKHVNDVWALICSELIFFNWRLSERLKHEETVTYNQGAVILVIWSCELFNTVSMFGCMLLRYETDLSLWSLFFLNPRHLHTSSHHWPRAPGSADDEILCLSYHGSSQSWKLPLSDSCLIFRSAHVPFEHLQFISVTMAAARRSKMCICICIFTTLTETSASAFNSPQEGAVQSLPAGVDVASYWQRKKQQLQV